MGLFVFNLLAGGFDDTPVLRLELPVDTSDFRSRDSVFDTSECKLDGEGGHDSIFSVSGEDGSDIGSPENFNELSTFPEDLSIEQLSTASAIGVSKPISTGPSVSFKLAADEDFCVVNTRVFNREIISSREFRGEGFIFVRTGGSSDTVGFFAASFERSSTEISEGAGTVSEFAFAS